MPPLTLYRWLRRGRVRGHQRPLDHVGRWEGAGSSETIAVIPEPPGPPSLFLLSRISRR